MQREKERLERSMLIAGLILSIERGNYPSRQKSSQCLDRLRACHASFSTSALILPIFVL